MKTGERVFVEAVVDCDEDDKRTRKGLLIVRVHGLSFYVDKSLCHTKGSLRAEAIEECAHQAELCGVDSDGHYCAHKIRALLGKESK